VKKWQVAIVVGVFTIALGLGLMYVSVGTAYTAVDGESASNNSNYDAVETIQLDDLDGEDQEMVEKLINGSYSTDRPDFIPENDNEVFIDVTEGDEVQTYLVNTQLTTAESEVTRSIAFLVLMTGMSAIVYGYQYREVERIQEQIDELLAD